MNKQIKLVLTYEDILAQAEDDGIKLTTKRAKELMNEWARAIQDTLCEKACELIRDCVLPDAEESE